MERRMKMSLARACALAFVIAALAVCSNPIDIVGNITTEVKVSNNKFLIIKNAVPAKNALDVNPSEPLWFELDRDLDTSSVTAQAIVFSPAATWTYTYNDSARTLYIQPDNLNGDKNYTVTITTSLKGKDGNSMQQQYVVPFHTAKLPSGSVKINNNAVSTSSNLVTLNISYNDVTTQMRYSLNKNDIINDTAGWVTITSSTITNFDLGSGQYGTRTVYIQFRDNVTDNNRTSGTIPLNDSIIYGTPTVTSATLNSTSLGTVTVSWNPLPRQDEGTNYYYLYREDAPSGANLTYLGNTTGSSMTVSVPQGQLYYFLVIFVNPVAGAIWASGSPVGYTSNIAIIYNSGDPTDTTNATNLKTLLTTNLSSSYAPYVTGIMPTWSVTLIPQSFVSTTYAAGNVFYGAPVIITPATTLYGNANQVRNVTAHGHGVVAMGYGGTRLIDVVSANFAGWGYTGTSPSQIGFGASASGIVSAFMYTWTSGNSTWSYPLSSTVFTGPLPTLNNTRTQISYTSLNRYSVYLAADGNPTDGYIYGRDDQALGSHYYPVVRQGRFLQFGFDGMTDRPYTGWVYLTNLVYRMSGIYF